MLNVWSPSLILLLPSLKAAPIQHKEIMEAVSLSNQHEWRSVVDFYSGKSVFVTGGTGFIGKILVEKLLYSCKDIARVYVLVRDKKGVDAKTRLESLVGQPLFKRLKDERPRDLNKIVLINGDITALNLGICPNDLITLVETVSVVIHSAATVKSNEPLKVLMQSNLEGTKRVLELSKRMKKIKAFVYVSTAYSNCNRTIIEEVVYPPPAALSDVYTFVAQQDGRREDERQTKEFMNGHPTPYTFTKALTETYLATNYDDVPTVIIRPSIVSACIDEPIAGWIDNWRGATGLIVSVAKGINRVLLGSGDVVLDLIPADYVTNLIVVAAALGTRSDKLCVYNSGTSSSNPITLTNLMHNIRSYSKKHKHLNGMFYPNVFFTRHRWLVNMITFFLQVVPAYLGDIWLRISGKKPRFMKMHGQLLTMREILEYFYTHSFEIRCEATRALHASLSSADQDLFPMDPACFDWNHYMPLYFRGIWTFLLCNK